MLEIIGTDASIGECLDSGYMMMEYNTRDVKDGQTIPCKYNFLFLQTWGGEWKGKVPKTSVGMLSGRHPHFDENPRVMSASFTLLELIAIYADDKKDIDNFCDCDHSLDLASYDKVYDVLHLADNIQAYNGRIMENQYG